MEANYRAPGVEVDFRSGASGTGSHIGLSFVNPQAFWHVSPSAVGYYGHGSAVQNYFNRLGQLTDERSSSFDRRIFETVRSVAYHASPASQNGWLHGLSQDEIWNAAKLRIAMGFAKMQIPDDSWHSYMPDSEWYNQTRYLFGGLESGMGIHHQGNA